jgi:S1-C subfamily serine protease
MANQWYYTPDGRNRLGPVPLGHLQQLARSGQLQPTHMVRREEDPKWAAAGSFAELFLPRRQQPPAPAGITKQQNSDFFEVIDTQGQPPAPAGITKQPSRTAPARSRPTTSRPPPPPEAPAGPRPSFWRRLRLPLRRRKLRRRLQRQQGQLEQCFVDLGIRLLAAGTVVPGCEMLTQQFRRLSQTQELTRQAARAGDKTKRREAARLETEMRSLYGKVGRQALASRVPFDGRKESETHCRAIQAAIALTQQQVEAVSRELGPPSRKAPLVWAGVGIAVGAALLLLGLGLLFWWPGAPAASEDPARAAAENASPAANDKPPADKPPTRSLQEWFAHLAPAVPLIEVGDSGFGSGFLVKKNDKYLVVTNKHVVENSGNGLKIHFLHGKEGEEKRFTVPPDKTSVVAIHRSADLAVVDVSKAAADIERLKIEPVRLAPAEDKENPKPGANVFAIGHPGGAGEEVLTRTLTNGIVSARGRKHASARYLQVTVAINPGNSGGPLFDYEGRVVGVNTFIIRRSADRDIPLEALNFALEGEFVHEILGDPSKSLDAAAIAGVLKPAPTDSPAKLKAAIQAKVQKYLAAGYRPFTGSPQTSTKILEVPKGQQRMHNLRCRRPGSFAVAAVSVGAKDIDLAVLHGGAVIAKADRPGTDAEVQFTTQTPGLYPLVVLNPSQADGVVVLLLFAR